MKKFDSKFFIDRGFTRIKKKVYERQVDEQVKVKFKQFEFNKDIGTNFEYYWNDVLVCSGYWWDDKDFDKERWPI